MFIVFVEIVNPSFGCRLDAVENEKSLEAEIHSVNVPSHCDGLTGLDLKTSVVAQFVNNLCHMSLHFVLFLCKTSPFFLLFMSVHVLVQCRILYLQHESTGEGLSVESREGPCHGTNSSREGKSRDRENHREKHRKHECIEGFLRSF